MGDCPFLAMTPMTWKGMFLMRTIWPTGLVVWNSLGTSDWPMTQTRVAPVMSRSGEVLGGVFFGHPKVGDFGERDVLQAVLAGRAAVAGGDEHLLHLRALSELPGQRVLAAARSDDEDLHSSDSKW